MKKSPNQNPHLVTSFDLTDLFTPRGDLKKMIWGTTFGVKDNLPIYTHPDAHSGPYNSMEAYHLCLEECIFCNSLAGCARHLRRL
jgi:hypothetical protein